MNRLSEIEIGGIKYLLNFSVQAASEIYERYGDTAGMQECIMDGYTEKSIAETLWVLDILAQQGAEYVKLHEDGEQLFLCRISCGRCWGFVNLMKCGQVYLKLFQKA